MHRTPTQRWAFWAFAVALLLKAAMPLLATASAELQGKTLVEVCTVYGVSLVPLDGQNPDPAPEPMAQHAGDHCALTALVALVAPEPLPALEARVLHESPAPRAHPCSQAPDVCATWVARLKHGPPVLS